MSEITLEDIAKAKRQLDKAQKLLEKKGNPARPYKADSLRVTATFNAREIELMKAHVTGACTTFEENFAVYISNLINADLRAKLGDEIEHEVPEMVINEKTGLQEVKVNKIKRGLAGARVRVVNPE